MECEKFGNFLSQCHLQGDRIEGRPHNSQMRDTEWTVQSKGYSWMQMKFLAMDRVYWRCFVSGLPCTCMFWNGVQALNPMRDQINVKMRHAFLKKIMIEFTQRSSISPFTYSVHVPSVHTLLSNLYIISVNVHPFLICFNLQMSHLLEWSMWTCWETLRNSLDMLASLLTEYGIIFTRKIASSRSSQISLSLERNLID